MSDYIFHKGEPHPFSNFHPVPIDIDWKIWPTSEHYFQAMKFKGISDDYVEKIRLAESPGKAYRLGWGVKKIRSDWGVERDHAMKRALVAKFNQNVDLKWLLLETGDKNIIQRCTRDKYWGDGGGAGKGENMLGKILMEVRASLKESLREALGAQ